MQQETAEQSPAKTETPSLEPAAPSPTSSPTRPSRAELPSDAEAEAAIERAAAFTRRLNAARATGTIAPAVRAAAADARVMTAEQIQRNEQRQAEYERGERVAACIAQAKIPPRFRTASLEDTSAVPDDALPQYREAVAKLSLALTRRGIYALIGQIGPGKSHMACALVLAFCRAGRAAKYMQTAEYIDEYRSRWKSPTAGATSAYRAMHARLSLLVLDEWQVRNDTANENLILLQLLNAIYDSGGSALLVSNHANKEEFQETIDARVADRICDGGGVIVCDWPSLRGRLKKTGDT